MLKRTILRLLARSDPYALPKAVLLAEARHALGHVGEDALDAALADLERSGHAIARLDALTDDAHWLITPRGRQVAEAL